MFYFCKKLLNFCNYYFFWKKYFLSTQTRLLSYLSESTLFDVAIDYLKQFWRTLTNLRELSFPWSKRDSDKILFSFPLSKQKNVNKKFFLKKYSKIRSEKFLVGVWENGSKYFLSKYLIYEFDLWREEWKEIFLKIEMKKKGKKFDLKKCFS